MDMYSQNDMNLLWDRNVSSNVTLNIVTFWLISLPINMSRPKNGRDGTRLIPPRQVSLKLNHYNKVRK